MDRVALLIAGNIASDAPDRRADAHQFDLELAVLSAACERLGIAIEPVRWAAPDQDWGRFRAALALCAWDYQDASDSFLARLDTLEAGGVRVFNSPGLIRWNIRKTYLRELAARGAPIIPTLWPDDPQAVDVQTAFDTFGCDSVVLKRQVGGGARAQQKYSRTNAPKAGRVLDRPGMIQPFVPAVASEGEFSFLFIDGAFSHALVKRPASGDYRIQAAYGGVSKAVAPTPADLDQARDVMAALDSAPLYARIDMVRDAAGRLMLMELEVIEPFLFPAEGPQLAEMFAAGLRRRLG